MPGIQKGTKQIKKILPSWGFHYPMSRQTANKVHNKSVGNMGCGRTRKQEEVTVKAFSVAGGKSR